MFLPDPCRCRCAARHLRTSLDTHATRGFGRLQGVPMMVRQRTEAGMAAGGRGAFRNETRATRLERLHGPKRRMLSPEDKEKLRQEALEERDRYRREQSMKDDRRKAGDA